MCITFLNGKTPTVMYVLDTSAIDSKVSVDSKVPNKSNTHELQSLLEYTLLPKDLMMIIMKYLAHTFGVYPYDGGFILHIFPNALKPFRYHNNTDAENGGLSGCWGQEECTCESGAFKVIKHPLGLLTGFIADKLDEFNIKDILPENVVGVYALEEETFVGCLMSYRTFRIYEIVDDNTRFLEEYKNVANVLQTDGAFAILYVDGKLDVYGDCRYGGDMSHRDMKLTERVHRIVNNDFGFLIVLYDTDNKNKRVISWAYNDPNDSYDPDSCGYFEEKFYKNVTGCYGHMGGNIPVNVSGIRSDDIAIYSTDYAFAALIREDEEHYLYTWGHPEFGGRTSDDENFSHDTQDKEIYKIFCNTTSFLVLYTDGTIEIIGTCAIPDDFKNQNVKTCHPYEYGFIIQLDDNTYVSIGNYYIDKFRENLDGITAGIVTIILSDRKYAIHFDDGTVVFVY